MKKTHEILTAQHHKLLYNINHSEKEGKNIQTAGYNGARTVDENSNKVALWGGGAVNAILSDQIFDYEISSKNGKVLSSDFMVIINIFRKTSSRTSNKQQQFPHPSGTLIKEVLSLL